MACPFAVTTQDWGNTPGPKMAELGELHHKLGTPLLEIG
jgi:hypothetical protein